MTVAIDLDGTWTLQPTLWRLICAMIAAMPGCRVLMVTGRESLPTAERERHGVPTGMEVWCTNHLPKAAFMVQRGIQVDIWIDNEPHLIGARPTLETSDDSKL